MPTLAPKLPWQHAFAGGYPRRGGQPLPTDPDAIDYLNRVAAADGAAVEVGIAQAVDGFVKGCKADGTWDAIKASCIMCGARTLSGALVPLKGAAPTGYNWTASDYSRSLGLKGNGSTKYIDSNRAGNADGLNDAHLAVYKTDAALPSGYIIGRFSGAGSLAGISNNGSNPRFWINDALGYTPSTADYATAGLFAASRNSSSQISWRSSTSGGTASATSNSVSPYTTNVLASTNGTTGTALGFSDARLAFYSIGSAIDLAALDERVTNLVTAIKFHSLTGLLPNDYDVDTISYIVAAIEAGGTL